MDDKLLTQRMQHLGLSEKETTIFMTLLEQPKSHAEITRATGLARTNVYRIVDEMVSKGLVREQATHQGKLIACADPAALELLVIEQERIAHSRRENFEELLPLLQRFNTINGSFAIETYKGLSGFRQMLWNELKSKGEILCFASESLNVAMGKRWAENYRNEVVRRGIACRNIENSPAAHEGSNIQQYYAEYQVRYVPTALLRIKSEITIYDDTVCIYNSWSHNIRLGTEIKNPFFASFMRQMFEHYWGIAQAEPFSEHGDSKE